MAIGLTSCTRQIGVVTSFVLHSFQQHDFGVADTSRTTSMIANAEKTHSGGGSITQQTLHCLHMLSASFVVHDAPLYSIFRQGWNPTLEDLFISTNPLSSL
jgi:hypothetical protein